MDRATGKIQNSVTDEVMLDVVDADIHAGIATPFDEQVSSHPVGIGQCSTIDASLGRCTDGAMRFEAVLQPVRINCCFRHIKSTNAKSQ